MIEIRLLGQFSVTSAGRPLAIASRPAQSLLAFLALNPGVRHRRERLAGLLWPDSAEAQARRNLRQALWQLRRALGDESQIDSDDVEIVFAPRPGDTVDADSVSRPLTGGETADDLIEQLRPYAGELLPGFYDEWVGLERERLRAAFERKMSAALDALSGAHRWDDALVWSERWIAQGGAPEPAYRAAISAHAAKGEIAQMADAYRRCAEALQRDLGIEPSPHTRALFERLRTGRTPTPAERPRHNLPLQLTSFVGREKDIAEAVRRIAASRLVTITGAGGTGKSRLASQVGQSLLDDFARGVWLIELAGVSDPGLIAQTVMSILDVQEQPHQSVMRSLLDHLRPASALLILDNCEHLVDACAAFAEAVLRSCPRVKILSTSRETLGVAGEAVFRLPTLGVPEEGEWVSLSDIQGAEAVRLFVERATAVHSDFALNADNAASVARICRRLDGMPLAIELAAARVRAMSVEQIAARLDDRFRLLGGGNRTALPRHQTLRALVDWSWELLTEPERHLLGRLSVFADGWTLAAAEAVCEGGGSILEPLARLVEKSLVRSDTRGNEARYSLLETVRLYAADKLYEAGGTETARDRHLSFFIGLAEAAEPRLRSGEQLAWLARLDAEQANLRAALQWSLCCGQPELALRLSGGLYRYWYFRATWSEGREWLRQALDKGPVTRESAAAMKRARVRALCAAGWMADEDGSELPHYSESLVLSREIGDVWHEAFSLRGLASAEVFRLEGVSKSAYLESSLALFESLGDDWGIGLALFNLGWIGATGGNALRAAVQWERALRHFQRSGDRWGEAVTVGAMSYVLRMRGDYAGAVEHTARGLALFAELVDKSGIALSQIRLASIATRRGDFAEAAPLLETSLALQRERGDRINPIGALEQLGTVAIYQGDFARAEAVLGEGLALARELDALYDVPECQSLLASVAYQRGDLERAEALWVEALSAFRGAGVEDGAARTMRGLAMVAMRRGDVSLAWARLAEGLDDAPPASDRREVAMALRDAGDIALAAGDVGLARRRLAESLRLHREIGDKFGVARGLEAAAGALSAATPLPMGMARVAAELLAGAAALRREMGAPVPPVEQPHIDATARRIRDALGEAAPGAAIAEGSERLPEAMVSLALAALEGGDVSVAD